MKSLITLLLTLPLFCGTALAFNLMPAAQLKASLDNSAPLNLVDIQVSEEFTQHHLPQAIPTYAYPVKTAEDKNKLQAILPQLTGNADPIVIVCPRGKGGAERTYSYLKEQGIAEERLFILEEGQQGWPYAELVVSN